VEDNEALLYNPKQVAEIARLETVAEQIFGNLTLADKYMKQSWQEYPEGSDAQVDALRHRAQNLIDLQRALANSYEDFASAYLRDRNLPVQVQDPMQFRSELLSQAGALSGYTSKAEAAGLTDAATTARYGTVTQVVDEYGKQQHEFATQVISTYNTCSGTHYHLENPVPIPSPSSTP
jgi:hypothetical protein